MIHRKIGSFFKIMQKARNWPSLCAWRAGCASPPEWVYLRSGLKLRFTPNVAPYWTSVFFTCFVDVYHYTGSEYSMVVDLGANVGGFSLFASHLNPDTAVYGFEPQPALVAQIRENAERNHLHRVHLSADPVTGDGRVIEFFANRDNSSAGAFDTPGSTARELRSSQSLASLPWDSHDSAFIKMDVEGMEGELIEWICLNRRQLPDKLSLICEHHSFCPISLEQCAQRLKGVGFDVSTREAYGDSLLCAYSKTA